MCSFKDKMSESNTQLHPRNVIGDMDVSHSDHGDRSFGDSATEGSSNNPEVANSISALPSLSSFAPEICSSPVPERISDIKPEEVNTNITDADISLLPTTIALHVVTNSQESIKRKRGRPRKSIFSGNVMAQNENTADCFPSLAVSGNELRAVHSDDHLAEIGTDNVQGEALFSSESDSPKNNFLASLDIISPDVLEKIQQNDQSKRKLKQRLLSKSYESDALSTDGVVFSDSQTEYLSMNESGSSQSSVNIPRKRGRPRKDSVKVHQINVGCEKALSLGITLPNSYDNSTLNMSSPSDFDNPTLFTSPDSLIISPSASPSVHSGDQGREKRQPRLPLKFRDFSSEETEVSFLGQIPSPMIKTGKRGRPRKYRISASENDIEQSTTSEQSTSLPERDGPWDSNDEILVPKNEKDKFVTNQRDLTSKPQNIMQSKANENQSSFEEQGSEVVILSARKRGRPRKSLPSLGSESKLEQTGTGSEISNPKKRGRPKMSEQLQIKLNIDSLSDLDTDDCHTEDLNVSFKKKRGRPKKSLSNTEPIERECDLHNMESEASQQNVSEISCPSPKKRGRPQKYEQGHDESIIAVDPEISFQKKKGRPKKSPSNITVLKNESDSEQIEHGERQQNIEDISSSSQKKRGRPKKYISNSILLKRECDLQQIGSEVRQQIVSEISSPSPKIRGRPKKSEHTQATLNDESLGDVDTDPSHTDDLNVSFQKKRGRPKKSLSNIIVLKTDSDLEQIEDGEILSPKKRGRPKKSEQVQTIEIDRDLDLDRSHTDDLNVSFQKKRVRPKKYISNTIPLEGECNLQQIGSEERQQNGSENSNLSSKKRGRPKKSEHRQAMLNDESLGDVDLDPSHRDDLNVSFQKKRGRPKKSLSNITVLQHDSDLEQIGDGERQQISHSYPKKKGHPRKSEQPQGNDPEQSQTKDLNVSIQKKRGRPKTLRIKTENNGAKNTTTDFDCKTPKKRGRPRKYTDNVSQDLSANCQQDDSYSDSDESMSAKQGSVTNKTPGRKRGRKLSLWKKLETGPVDCKSCGKIFPSSREIGMHMMFEHQALWSPDCPEGSTNRRALVAILKVVKKLTCQKCGKSHKFIHAYLDHMEWCGREQLTYTCEICGHGGLMLKWKKSHMKDHVNKEKNATLIASKDEEMALLKKQRNAAKKAIIHLKEVQKHLQNDNNKKKKRLFKDDSDIEALISDEDDDKDEDFDENEKFQINKNILPARNVGRVVPNLSDTFSTAWKQNHTDWEKSVFSDLYPRKVDWNNRLTGAELDEYLPESRESVHTKFSDIENGDTTKSPPNLKLFESLDGECFYVGGPVWSSAWCPTPPDCRHGQYVSIACHKAFEEEHSSYEEYSGRGLIQIWDLGQLTIDSEQFLPRFALGIAHDSGCVYDMSWCPAGCVRKPGKDTNSQGEEVMPRLGLLALACSDSTIRIYSVPDPSELTDDHEEQLICKASPSFILHSKFPGPGESRGCCMSVDWDPNKERSLILAGYGKGYICIFDLNTQSPLLTLHNLTSPKELFPFRSILGHSLKVASVQWCPCLPDYFLSGSYDRLFCVWDMKDDKRCVLREMCEQITAVRWIHDYHQPISTQLENMLLFNSRINLLHPLDKTGAHKKVLTNTSLFGSWDMDVSPWLHLVIFSNNLGHVTGIKLDLFYDHHRKKKTGKRSLFFLYEALTEMDDEKTNSNNNSGLSEEVAMETDQSEDVSIQAAQKSSSTVEESNRSSKENDKPEENLRRMHAFSYQETKQRCCLHFKTNNTLQNAGNVWNDERLFCLAKSESDLPKEKLSTYPLSAVYSVSCSPNASSCSWVVSGGQSGIVRLSNLSGFITDSARESLHEAQLVDSPSHKH